MTRSGTIPLSQIEWVRICFNTRKLRSTKANLKRLLAETGGDMLFNGAIFLRNLSPCCHLKAEGRVKCRPAYTAWGISWNGASDFTVERLPNAKANYMECVHAIIGGEKIGRMNYGADMAYKTHRTAVGTKDGRFAYYVTQNNYSPEQLRDVLFSAGWDNAIMLDGGGSTCFMDKNGRGFTGDGRVIPFFLVLRLKNQDSEPKGDKPMVPIFMYSVKKNGGRYAYQSDGKRCRNFRVREFKCSDGTDVVPIAPKLVDILQAVRDWAGAPVTVTRNGGYRTPGQNVKSGGATYSQHLYGTAADIVVSGKTPEQVADFVRGRMKTYGGVGRYETFTHVDVRDTVANWNG